MPGTDSSSRRVLAVIPYFHQKRQLDRCLEALSRSTVPVEVFVHDNSITNIGFTRAINNGLRDALSRGFEFALPLNQDCYLRPDAVEQLIRLMDGRPRCAIAGVKQVHSSDEDRIVHGGCGRAYPAGVSLVGRKSAGHHAVSRPMPWVNGAAMFARTAAVVEFGLLDERMAIICSDSDWCYTARARGWEVWYCADAEAVHEMGITAYGPPPAFQKVFLDDVSWWRDKWMGSALFQKLVGEFEPAR